MSTRTSFVMRWLVVMSLLLPCLVMAATPPETYAQTRRFLNNGTTFSMQPSTQTYTVEITSAKFTYRILGANGTPIVNAFTPSGSDWGGVSFSVGGGSLQGIQAWSYVDYYEPHGYLFDATTTGNLRVLISVNPQPTYVKIHVQPFAYTQPYTVSLRTAAELIMYGLGDLGGYPNDYTTCGTNPSCYTDTTINSTNKAGINAPVVKSQDKYQGFQLRFASNFAIYPSKGYAAVFISDTPKRIINTPAEGNQFGLVDATNPNGHDLYYLLGDPSAIYATYKTVLAAHGYTHSKPRYAMFDVGFEAWGQYGWEPYQTGVLATINQFVQPPSNTNIYRFRWGVIGSAFWKGQRGSLQEGTTSSFGMWDDTVESGRISSTPNPRFPTVAALKQAFQTHNMLLMIGMRTAFVPTTSAAFNPVTQGLFAQQGADNQYFLRDATNQPISYDNSFPNDGWMLDSKKPSAVTWFANGMDLWGVDGFKEDTMLFDPTKVVSEDKLNSVNTFFHDAANRKQYTIIVRNSNYTAPGDIVRLDDANFANESGTTSSAYTNKDRLPINGLNLAASGVPNIYPEVVGGLGSTLKVDTLVNKTYSKNYLLRHALFAAVSPAMAMGVHPATIDSSDTVWQQHIHNAALWHAKFAPYIYSAALDTYVTGYPSTMTPLPIAYPNDSYTYDLASVAKRQYQWMLGPSLMAAPIYGEDAVPNDLNATTASIQNTRNVYLPAGRWFDFNSTTIFTGPMTITNRLYNHTIPVFIGGKGIVVFRPNDPSPAWPYIGPGEENTKLRGRVYPVLTNSSYTFNYPSGNQTSTITNTMPMNLTYWNCPDMEVIENNVALESTDVTCSSAGDVKKYIDFPISPGKNYTVRLKQ